MKTLAMIVCMALLGGITSNAFGQETVKQEQRQKPTAEEMATKRTEKLTKLLELSDGQQKQVHALILDHAKQKEQVNNTKLTQDERKANMKGLHTSFEASLKKILTKEQLEKYLAHKEEMKQKKGHHGHHDYGNGNGKK